MDHDKLSNLTATDLAKKVQSGELSVVDIASSIIERVEAVEPKVHGFACFDKDVVLQRAEDLQKKGAKGKLAGVPIAIKDNMCIKNEFTTCSSNMLKGFKPPYNATAVEKLIAEDALLVGKANMDEFGFGSSCETSCYGPTKNPYDLARIPGGSSGGPAAVVAAEEAVCALGSDTGGSIRQPAALCGVVGLKPTYGRVSRYGLIAFASSLDQIGPLTKNVADCALLMNVIAGFDPLDSTSYDAPCGDYTSELKKDIKKLRIGLPKEYFIEGLDGAVKKRIDEAIAVLKDLGAEVVDISLPHTDYAVAVYCIVGCSEASSNLARFDGVRYGLRIKDNDIIDMYKKTRADGFGKEAKRRIILGTYSLSSGYYDAYYIKAQKVRALIRRDFDEAFKACDLVLTPTSPTPAFKLGEKLDDPLKMYLSDIFTISANLAGIPAISVPCGYSDKGLPVGLQFMAKPFDEKTLFRAAYCYEQNAKWEHKEVSL